MKGSTKGNTRKGRADVRASRDGMVFGKGEKHQRKHGAGRSKGQRQQERGLCVKRGEETLVSSQSQEETV